MKSWLPDPSTVCDIAPLLLAHVTTSPALPYPAGSVICKCGHRPGHSECFTGLGTPVRSVIRGHAGPIGPNSPSSPAQLSASILRTQNRRKPVPESCHMLINFQPQAKRCPCRIVSIFRSCEVRTEISVSMVTVWHHEALPSDTKL